MGAVKKESKLELFISPRDYFSEIVQKAISNRRVESPAPVQVYLTNLLEFYLDARNLFDDETTEAGVRKPKTLAELYLTAQNSEWAQKVEILKKLADRSLYLSGFFGDSLERKIVDVDYYAEMGGAAYASLSENTREEDLAEVYHIFSRRFVDYMDVLTYISQNSLIQNNQSLLRLYDRYLRTGSELAREKLAEMGVLTLPRDQAKLAKQN